MSFRSVNVQIPAFLVICLGLLAVTFSTAQKPKLEAGTLPRQWNVSGPNCENDRKEWQVHRFNSDLYILRESGCSDYEKPILYLIFGEERALLEDTGAGNTEVEKVVFGLIEEWAREKGRKPVPLTVIHSHAHGDHKSGDARFAALPNVTLIPAEVDAIRKAVHIGNWPVDAGYIELGNRRIDVLGIPGHDTASVALYDLRTGLLLTGDTLYPGRLYLRDLPAYVASVDRLVKFTQTRPVAHILGTHIEQSRTPFVDYPVRTIYQPDETPLEMSRGDLLELQQALHEMNGTPVLRRLSRFTIYPVKPPNP